MAFPSKMGTYSPPCFAGSHAERFSRGVGFWRRGTAKNTRLAHAPVGRPRPKVATTQGGLSSYQNS